ncbi:MAG TPA: RNA-binding cell elongation regulator Jag/EloR [Ilumatobacteraceae bacterium]|nr:RNA-binding cell elongation regulator Jag/EloR [Ilumatobacteraceae bacterium]
MEWVETIGKTVAEAKEKALDQLGVHEEDADFEVLEEPKQGLFGRVRGEARVRARVRPTQARQKVDRRDRKRSEKSDKASASPAVEGEPVARAPRAPRAATAKASTPPVAAKSAPTKQTRTRATTDESGRRESRTTKTDTPSTDGDTKEQLVDAQQVGEEAVRFMTELVSAFGLTGTAELVQDGDDLEVRVHGQELGLLVGPRGTTLQAVQDLARVAAQRRLGDHETRLRVDVGGYRERRRVALGAFATQMASEVTTSGVARVLEPMSSADRKIIHDTLSGVEGIATRSEGDDPNRRVIIAPANA